MLSIVLLIAGIQAYYGGYGKQKACLDYSLGRQADATLVAEAVECKGNKATFVGWYCNVRACAAAVQQLGGTLFKWGQDGSGKFTTTKNYRKSKAGWKTTGECWMEEIGKTDCKPQDAQFDVFKVNGGPISQDATVIKKRVECKSGDKNLGMKGGVLDCMRAVEKEGGKYFIFSRPREGKDLQCWMEHTSSAACTEGWETDSYDFWQVGGGADFGYTCVGKCAGSRKCHMPSGQCRKNINVPETSCAGACWNSCCNHDTVRCEKCKNTDLEVELAQHGFGAGAGFQEEEVSGFRNPARAKCGEGMVWNLFQNMCVMDRRRFSALAMDTTPHATGPSPVVSGFAALGLAFLLFGSYKFYCGKSA